MRHFALAAILVLASAGPAVPQDAKGFDKIDQKRVDAAIEKGVGFLKSPAGISHAAHRGIDHSNELILYTLFKAGVPPSDPVFDRYMLVVEGLPLKRTYNVALQAMLLEELDRAKYQARLLQCAQFLVDNQHANGQWSYGEPTPAVKEEPATPTGGARAATASGGGAPPKDLRASAPDPKKKPAVAKKIPVRQTRVMAGAGGDNSNSQYAALGLRACWDAGIQIPEPVITKARNWWVASQHPAGADAKNPGAPAGVATGPGGEQVLGPPRGWCYRDVYGVCKGGPAYAAMTAGATGAVVIYDYMLGKDWRKDVTVQSGMGWLAKHWSVTQDIGPSEVEGGSPEAFLYYYLYALERLGMLYDTGAIGDHPWYPEGAEFLLKMQKPDGSWEGLKPEKKPSWDTCFAILFLKRATRPLVATEGGGKK
ncbi:MAG TPA: hypothetical protein VJB14_10140 [Planctomycetota bacterium]|nr:hypothetical protein [Planctomycetota bacterium]